jgi:hypothetical protein
VLHPLLLLLVVQLLVLHLTAAAAAPLAVGPAQQELRAVLQLEQ